VKVLIVEDDHLLALFLSQSIIELGYSVCDIARDEDGALAKVARHKPTAVLMDVRLANDTSGISAARKLYRLHGIRCIFVSGSLDSDIRDQLASVEPVAFVDKPIEPSVSKEALEEAIRQSGAS
jgi:CheY-like chemotaxis protein